MGGSRGRNASRILERSSELSPEEVVGVKVRVKDKRVPGRGNGPCHDPEVRKEVLHVLGASSDPQS